MSSFFQRALLKTLYPPHSKYVTSPKLWSNSIKFYSAHAPAGIDPSKLIIRTTDSPRPKPSFKNLKFGQIFTDHMLLIDWSSDSNSWSSPQIKPYSNLELDPSSSVLHYATTCFEGFKAYKRSKDDPIRFFRPDLNMNRFNLSAQRLAFPTFDGPSLLELIKKLIKLDSDWIPTDPGHSLYIRPTLIGSSPGLGVGKPNRVTLFVICSPVGPYYTKGFQPISLLATTKYCRAWPGGSGGYKLGANYPTGILAQAEANLKGYEQVLWLFGDQDLITEVGTMNIFVALEDEKGSVELVTPPLDDKILPGITRQSTIELIQSHINLTQVLDGLPSQLKLSQRPVTMSELVHRSQKNQIREVFGTGTAAIVSPVERISYLGQDLKIPVGSNGLGQIADVIQREILGRQIGEIQSDWSVLVD